MFLEDQKNLIKTKPIYGQRVFFLSVNGNKGFYVKSLQIGSLTSRGTAMPLLKENKCSFKGEWERNIYF